MDHGEREAAPDVLPVPEVPGYDVGRLLGRGGSAAVWLGTDRGTGREVALKCFAVPGASGDVTGGPVTGDPAIGGRWQPEDTVAAVRRELRLLAALEHQHLVKAHAVVPVRGDGYGDGAALVLDYAAGGSLAELVAARGRLAAGEAVTVLTPIAEVLAYLHGNGFTHGDVSPGNVLFSDRGKPLLTDLGVGRMLADPADAAPAGTDGFSDDSALGAVRAGLRPEGDVYAVAAVGWFCLTGRAPEPEAERPPLPLLVPDVPAGLVDALEAGLRSDRRQRPSASEFAAAVFRSAPAAPVDLSAAVHPTVLPQLVTRRSAPATPLERRMATLRLLRSGLRGKSLPAAGMRARASATAQGRAARHASGPARRPGQRKAAAALMVAVLVTAAGATAAWLLVNGRAPEPGPLSGRASAAAAAAAAPPVPEALRELLASAQPEDAVRGLAGLRSYALSTGNLALLDQVSAPASPAAAADAELGSRLAESGHILDGFETRLSLVERRAESTAARAVVALRAASPAYRELDAAGVVVAEAAATDEQRLRLVLVPVGGRWRIQEILADAGG
jgi:serine/threonine protein kinase